MKKLKIAYITTYNSNNIHNWSGTGTYISKCLHANNTEIIHIGNLKNPYHAFSLGKTFLYRLLRKRHLINREPHVLKSFARQINRSLKNHHFDIIFSPGTIPISALETDIPIVFWTDTTFAGMLNYYANFSNLNTQSIKNGHFMEQQALSKARLAIYASDWAANTAINNYQTRPETIKVVPFGANIDEIKNHNDIITAIKNRSKNQCRLLFLGVDWERKGGEIAFEVARQLNNHGLNTELCVIGCRPKKILPNFVKVYGYISKKTQKGREFLNRVFSESHFLILPTKAECFGIVFAEAGSFGVPSLSYATGGVTTAILDGINGKLFPLRADANQYCDFILSLMQDRNQYENLAISSLNDYENRLNWKTAGETVRKLLFSICI